MSGVALDLSLNIYPQMCPTGPMVRVHAGEVSQPQMASSLPHHHPSKAVQRSAKVNAPGCVNAAGKLGRSDKQQQ